MIVVEPGKVELPAPGDDFDFEASWRAVGPDDIAGIVYTSGTTGEPKGVEWSHGALIDNMRGLHALAPGLARAGGWSPTCRWRTWPSAS